MLPIRLLLLLSSLLIARSLPPPRHLLRPHRPPLASLLDASDPWAMWTAASTCALAGLFAERTALGRSLSGPVCAMLFSATATNLGVLPSSGSPHLIALQTLAVRASLPLLLCGADLTRILGETGVLLRAFLLGSLATLSSSFIAFMALLPRFRTEAVEEGWKMAAALTAKNIGGGINFVAVADTLGLSASSSSLALTVDNLLGLLYFPLVSALSSPYEDNVTAPSLSSTGSPNNDSVNVESLAAAISLSLGIITISESIGRWSGVSPPVVTTFITVVLATAIPRRLASILGTCELLGKILLMLFFGSIGNSAGVLSALIGRKEISLLLQFGVILYGGHLGFLLLAGKLFGIKLPDLLLASNANIGNGATASALASSKGWSTKVTPALLVGTLGNVIGTVAGLWLGLNVLLPLCS